METGEITQGALTFIDLGGFERINKPGADGKIKKICLTNILMHFVQIWKQRVGTYKC
jgi:hypothetical protein